MNNKLINLIRPDLREFTAYSSARDEAKQGQVWLNANESPYPFAWDSETLINRYPDKQPSKLIKLLASLYKIQEKQIILSRGSDEVIDLLTRLFCRAGEDAIMICPPTFGMYSVCAQLQGAKIVKVPLIKENGYQLDIPSLLNSYRPDIKIIFLCSPNNPTGNLLNKEDIFYLCRELQNQCIIVVDEAYIEFSDSASLVNYIDQFDNLVILRTFSKAYGLAGARCGVLLGQEELVQWLLKIIPPYPLPTLTSQLLFQTLSTKQNQIEQQIKSIKSERARLATALKNINFIKTVWPSQSNFILIETDDCEKLMHECAKAGVVIRSMHDKPGLKNCVRISIGLPQENDQFINVLQNMSIL